MPTTIHIQIDRLILDGWPLDQRQARLVQAAIETELSRQWSTPGVVEPHESGLAVDRVAAPLVNWNISTGPLALGTQVGQAISRSITP